MRKSVNTQRSGQKRFLTLPKPKKIESAYQQKYKFYIGPGNNSSLVRRILSTRKNWEQTNDSKYLFINFKWQQTDKNYKYQSCIDNKVFKICLNHFEFHQELSNKENLYKNLHQYCQRQKIDLFDFVPLTFTLNLTDPNYDQHQSNFLKIFDHYLPEQRKKPDRKQLLFLKKRKTGIYKSLLVQLKQKNPLRFPIKQIYLQTNSKYLWILKPTFKNRGNGIHIFNSLQSLQTLMNNYISGQQISSTKSISTNQSSSPQIKAPNTKNFRIRQYTNHNQVTSFIVQKYLQKPLLYSNRKFDIRLWILVTHQMKVYMFKQGYMRTSSYKYSTNQEEISDLNVHLTNNAVQKNNTQYGKFQDGNQLSFKVLKNLIEQSGHSYTDVINKIKWIIKTTFLSVKKKLNKNQRTYCFQIYGYDFMLDQNCKPWLIQVNTNPCIQQSSVLLQNLLPRMLDDAFCLTIDRIFQTQKKGYNYTLQNQYSTDNLWQFIVDLKKVPQTHQLKNVSQQLISQNPSQIIHCN